MSSRLHKSLITIATLTALCTGALLAPSSAFAQDVAEPQEAPTPISPPMRCRAFMVPVAEPELDTTDLHTEAGKWTADREAEGWVLFNIDFEMGQKPTGYPTAWWQICLYRP